MLLFTPGPTPVLESVRVAMSAPSLHHRTPEFEAIFAKTRTHLFKLFNMNEVLMLASSGTGAMEAALTNLTSKKILTINAGKFGERFGQIAKAFNINYSELIYDWNVPASVNDILDMLKKDTTIDTIAIQISESAGGLRHPVEEIAKAVKAYNKDILIIADGITAIGVEPIDTSDLDIVISGSQKALMLPPGLSMMGLSKKAIQRIGGGKGYYLNLASEIKKQSKNTTAYTAPTTLIVGLLAMFEEIEKEGGLEKLYADTKKRARAVRNALMELRLELYPDVPAKSMTTIISKNANGIKTLLKEKYGVNLAGGQDHLKGKIFRINQMGLIKPYELAWVVNSIELALEDLDVRAYDGTANRVFNEVYFKET
jgi:aspartate aminotransferase-like enzyme